MFDDEGRQRRRTYVFLKIWFSTGFEPRKISNSSPTSSSSSSRPHTSVSNIILIWSSFPFYKIRPILASVKLSSFSPCFVSLLVWALLFNNSCKSKLIGARSIWKLFANRQTQKVFVHAPYFYIISLVRRSEEAGLNKRLSFIGSTLGEGRHIITGCYVDLMPRGYSPSTLIAAFTEQPELSAKRRNYRLFRRLKNLAPKSLRLIGW